VLRREAPVAARLLSQLAELSKEERSRAWNAPAAMYFVISVLPISITSGPPPPARVASNFCRWSPQFWYWRFTVVPGWSDWNFCVAAATTSGQPDCASTCSHTVMLLAADFLVA